MEARQDGLNEGAELTGSTELSILRASFGEKLLYNHRRKRGEMKRNGYSLR